ncbi:hypothetical protein SAMN02745165_02804 [Malonomonas rubra DSM 5091]|uniref:Uncharacterized protein n=1 Tax=Malonomonas rubra DSM 5091 TaxID=1122189 RepID=A0A1M6KUN9_MALRU|nr:hypothetical protein [Malonomonas rubra]SHJ62671.1 hypothetical protein SAMN02745165_02804 [Malonomonas rubra DSM 5091]
MPGITIEDLQLDDLTRAKALEQRLETTIVDDIIIATAHGLQLPEELSHIELYLERLKRVRLEIAASLEV